MSKASKRPRRAAVPATPERTTDPWRVLGPLLLVFATLACYWVPMTSGQTSILWDAADYYQVVQNYFSQELHAGRMPFWTPYPWAGYPFLADPQVGAWYPLNWPLFLIGVSPHMLVVEHWLHALLACFGAYLLTFRLVRHRQAAVLAGLCYGLSGFFVGHSSHTTMLQCAAWTPWLLWLLDRALESHAVRRTVLGGLAAGMMILAGHFQTILYSFLALALFAAARVIECPRRWARIWVSALVIPVIGTFLSAMATGPGLELAVNSVRASLSAVTQTEGLIPFSALATLVYPNFYGVFSPDYRGPQDITQFYFYAGFLLLPLAVFGLRNRCVRWAGLLLVIPAIWYAMGHSAGLYLLLARLPGFSSVRAPVNIWFVPALGLALLAGAGLAAVAGKWPVKWLPTAILLFSCLDLFYFQSATNPLAYARNSYEEVYGSGESFFRQAASSALPPLTRFEAPEHLALFGPMSHFFVERTEVVYGYGPLPFARYSDYVGAMAGNPKLRNGLNVSRWLDLQKAVTVHANPDVLPRANFPKTLVPVGSMEESKRRLVTLDQAREALVPASVAGVSQDGNGVAEVREYTPGHYRIHYRAASASVLRVGSAYFDGWTARAQGRRLDVFPVDHALTGMVVPAGEGDVDLDYHSTYFIPAALVSLLTLAACAALLLRRSPGPA
jgi:hypothetical protein